jgi:hypothetical protein
MIDTAKNALNTDTLEHLRDVAQDALGEHIPALAKRKKRSRRAPRIFFLLLFIAGGVAIATYVRKMSAPAPENADTAPDSFGTAVEDQREAMRISPGHA